MKRKILSWIVAASMVFAMVPAGAMASSNTNVTGVPAGENIAIDEVNFPDVNFRNMILNNYDENKDKVLSPDEIANTTEIWCGLEDLTDLTGIEYFTALKKLECPANSIKKIDVSALKDLECLDCSNNDFTEIDLSQNTKLKELNLFESKLTKLPLEDVPELEKLSFGNDKISTVDFSKTPNLTVINIYNSPLKTLDLSPLKNLDTLEIYATPLTKLSLVGNPKLKILRCSSNKLKSIDLSKNNLLDTLECEDNDITSLNLRNNPKLFTLSCSNNDIRSLDLNNNKNLHEIACSNTKISHLNLPDCTDPFSSSVSDNVYTVTGPVVNYQKLPANFNVNKIRNLKGGILNKKNKTITFNNSNTITYTYRIGNMWESVFKIKTTAFSKQKVLNVKTTSGVGNVRVNFNKVKNATGYKIAYKKVGTKNFKYIKVKNNSFTLRKLMRHKKYEIKVCALKGNVQSYYSKSVFRVTK